LGKGERTTMSNLFILDEATGEIVKKVDLSKEKLSVRSHAQDKAYHELKKGRSSSFTFTQMSNVHEVIARLTTAQCGLLLVLITYMDFDGTLRNPDKSPMKKKDIRKVLKLEGKRSFFGFIKVCLEAGIVEEVEDVFAVNERYHFKGKSKGRELIKIMSTKVRELHKENKLTDIGYLYKIQSQVHITRNVLVSNPNERDLDNLDYLSKNDLSKLLGVSDVQLSKVIGRLKVNGEQCVAQLKVGREVHFVVNPNIFSRSAKDETLSLLFSNKKSKGGKRK
jgi:hypothetical protein